MMDFLIEPFQYAFMQKAFLAVILASLNCAVIGSYVILRRMAFLGEALTHTLLSGIVFAFLKGIHLFWGALSASVVTALGIGFLSSREGVRQDTAIGVVLSFMFALGILMMSMIRSFRDFNSILFGSILGVTTGDLMLVATITAIVLVLLFLFHKELELSSYDHNYARLIRVRPNLLRYLLYLLVALSVVSAVQMMGALLTTALLIVPAAAAALIARSLFLTMVLGVIFAIISGIVGLYISYYLEVATGASIVIVAFGWFLFAAGLRQTRGLLRRK